MKPRSRGWAVFEKFRITKYGQPYLDRLRILQTPMFSIYFHQIHTADVDKFPHDHPWWFASLVLSGGYVERVYSDASNLNSFQTRTRLRGSLRNLPRNKAHQITEITGVLWTVVLTGPHHGSWRFWTSEGPIDWRITSLGHSEVSSLRGARASTACRQCTFWVKTRPYNQLRTWPPPTVPQVK